MTDALKAIEAFVQGSDVDEDDIDFETGWGYELPGRLAPTTVEYSNNYRDRKVVPQPPVILEGLGHLEYVEGYEGGEGGGEAAYQVLSLTAEDGSKRFFRKEGYYASHYGTDWDGDLYEVEPVTKSVTFYEQRK